MGSGVFLRAASRGLWVNSDSCTVEWLSATPVVLSTETLSSWVLKWLSPAERLTDAQLGVGEDFLEALGCLDGCLSL